MASFCKLLIDDDNFTSKLKIPPQFVNNFGEIFTQSSKMISLRIDDQSGKAWRVVIKQTGGFHFFTKGWTNFAKDVDLQSHSFLIFKLVDESEFHVSVYDTTGCDKDYSYSEDGEDDEVKNDEMGSYAKRWRFSKELKYHHFNSQRMNVPKAFVVGTGIATNREIKLVDGKGREWPVKVTCNRGMYGMTQGWKAFVTANGAIIGSIVSFEFVGGSGNLVRALVINNNGTLGNLDEESI